MIHLNAAEFRSNPYIKNIKIPTARVGDFTLTTAAYEPGEILEYDMPDFSRNPIEHRVGCFGERVEFPGIYEGVVPWMSVCPSEINSMARHIARAHGRVLVLGLGLGYYPYMIAARADVASIDIVECQPEIIELFEANILPQFEHAAKIRIIQADAFEYVGRLTGDEYDFCFADIWQNEIDGAWAYRKLHDAEMDLPGIEFAY